MTRGIIAFLLLVILLPATKACLEPRGGMTITSSVELCPGKFELNDPINVREPNVVVTCDGTELEGDYDGTGLVISAPDVTIHGCSLRSFRDAIYTTSPGTFVLSDLRVYDSFNGVSLVQGSVLLGDHKFDNVANPRVERAVENNSVNIQVPIPQEISPEERRLILFPKPSEEIARIARDSGLDMDAITRPGRFATLQKEAFVAENDTRIVITVTGAEPDWYVYEHILHYPLLRAPGNRLTPQLLAFPVKEGKIEYTIKGAWQNIDELPPVSILSSQEPDSVGPKGWGFFVGGIIFAILLAVGLVFLFSKSSA